MTRNEKAARAQSYKEKLLERLVLNGSEYWNIDFLYRKLATAIQMHAYTHTGQLLTMRGLGTFRSVYEIDLYLNERIESLHRSDAEDGRSMQEVVDYLNENYFDFISLDALARRLRPERCFLRGEEGTGPCPDGRKRRGKVHPHQGHQRRHPP